MNKRMKPLNNPLITYAAVILFGLCCPALVTTESHEAEITLVGTVTHHDFVGVYFVDVEEVVEGPPPLWNNVMINYFEGYQDEDIQPGDRVEVFGTLYWSEDEQSKGCSISLEKPEHFIKRIKENIPPTLQVYWNTLDFYTLGNPFEIAVTVCNTGGDASVVVTTWIGDNLIEPTTWYILSRRCAKGGWTGGSGPILEENHVQDGYIMYRVAAVAENEYGTDTYDETRYFPVKTTSQAGSATIFTREKCGRPVTAAIFLDGEYKGQTDSEGKLCISGLSPGVYNVVAVGTEEYTEVETAIEVKTVAVSCLFLEKKRNTPDLKITPSVLRFEPLNYGEMKMLTFQVENRGTGFLFWHVTDDREWITVHPEHGLVRETPSSVTVAVDAAKIKAGSYKGEIMIQSNEGVEYVEVTVSVVNPADAATFLGIFLVSIALVGLAAFALFKKRTIRVKKVFKKMRLHHLLSGVGICFLVILCIILRQNRVGLPALHIQSLLFLVTVLFFVLSFIVYLMRKSDLDRAFVMVIWKLFFIMIVCYGVGSMIFNRFALGVITDVHLTLFSLSIGYFVIFLFVISFALGMVMNLVLARGFGTILSILQKIFNLWSYIQVSPPKKISCVKSQRSRPQVIQLFFYYVFELLFASFWIVLVYSMEIGHQANILLIPIFVQLIPLIVTDLFEFLIPVIGFMLPLFILFPLFIAEDLVVGVDGRLVSPKKVHKLWSVITILMFIARAVSWGLADVVGFLWALWLLLPIQSGLALGYMSTRKWANRVAKERADIV